MQKDNMPAKGWCASGAKKLRLIILILIIVVAGALAARFIFGGSEDDWICVNEEWVKHGVPYKSMPTSGCGSEITNFQDCIDAGNPAMESWPRQCRVGDQTFTEKIGNELEKTDLIQIDNPRPNQTISSPLTVTGKARGYWFFEGDFPVVLTDWDGRIISEGIATAKTDWMVEDFVEFEATLKFEKSDTQISDHGSLILQKDNPSDLAENDDALEIPILFK